MSLLLWCFKGYLQQMPPAWAKINRHINTGQSRVVSNGWLAKWMSEISQVEILALQLQVPGKQADS